jgi:tetratricopeptide (TPR) repeat protein
MEQTRNSSLYDALRKVSLLEVPEEKVIEKADCYLEAGDFDKAEKVFARFFNREEDRAFVKGFFIELKEASIEDFPSFKQAFYAEFYLRRSNFEKAKECFHRSTSLSTREFSDETLRVSIDEKIDGFKGISSVNEVAYSTFFYFYYDLGLYKRAKRFIHKIMKGNLSNDQSSLVKDYLAKIYLREERYREAEVLYRELIAENNSPLIRAGAFVSLVDFSRFKYDRLKEEGNLERAMEILRKSIDYLHTTIEILEKVFDPSLEDDSSVKDVLFFIARSAAEKLKEVNDILNLEDDDDYLERAEAILFFA